MVLGIGFYEYRRPLSRHRTPREISCVRIHLSGLALLGRKGISKRISAAQVQVGSGSLGRPQQTAMTSTTAGPVRAIAGFLLHTGIAVFGTVLVEAPLAPYVRYTPFGRTSILLADGLSAVAAFGLGYSVYRLWQPRVSKWLWMAGLCWFGSRALLTLDGTHGAIWELAGTETIPDLKSLTNWSVFTLPFVRTAFYSLGALFSSRLHRPKCIK